jgi:hypothetical protein
MIASELTIYSTMEERGDIVKRTWRIAVLQEQVLANPIWGE